MCMIPVLSGRSQGCRVAIFKAYLMRKDMNQHAVFPGSFDPFTQGHAALVAQASALFSQVTVAVVDKEPAHTLFSTAQRTQAIKAFCQSLPQVQVVSFSGLLMHWITQNNATLIVRGLRNPTDLHYEMSLAYHHQDLNPEIKTLFLPALKEQSWISSTLVRDIIRGQGRVLHLIPKVCIPYYQLNYEPV
jgi:pantetheine-phosphate adenylyltransferase